MNGLDLFSGIGGLSLALEEWVKPIAYCEIDRYCQSVLLSRMSEGKLPLAPIWDNVETLNGRDFPNGYVNIIYGGFPCQDISVAGTRKGLEGERSGLFFEIIRLVKECEPRFIFLENVPGIRTNGLNEVIKVFTELRYDCRWTTVSAAELGAPHLRKRWFMLAYAKGKRRGIQPLWATRESKAKPYDYGKTQQMADTNGKRLEGPRWKEQKLDRPAKSSWWDSEPSVGRVADGISNRVDRIKSLGNAVVPLQAKTAFERLIGYIPPQTRKGE